MEKQSENNFFNGKEQSIRNREGKQTILNTLYL